MSTPCCSISEILVQIQGKGEEISPKPFQIELGCSSHRGKGTMISFQIHPPVHVCYQRVYSSCVDYLNSTQANPRTRRTPYFCKIKTQMKYAAFDMKGVTLGHKLFSKLRVCVCPVIPLLPQVAKIFQRFLIRH